MTQSDVHKILDDLENANAEREALKQKCHELENQVNTPHEEKSNISAEFEKLQVQVVGTKGVSMAAAIGKQCVEGSFLSGAGGPAPRRGGEAGWAGPPDKVLRSRV